MNSPFRIVVLASTRGTALQSIIDEIKAGRVHAEVAGVVGNVKEAYALERARMQGIASTFVDPMNADGSTKKSGEEYDRELASAVKKYSPDLVVLVGYMRILTPIFVREFPHKIINIHPALLPKYGGKGFFGGSVHEAVIAAGETKSGCTIHFVDEGVDTGKIILQKTCPVLPNDTPEALKERVQALEKEWYPKVIQMFVEGEIK